MNDKLNELISFLDLAGSGYRESEADIIQKSAYGKDCKLFTKAGESLIIYYDIFDNCIKSDYNGGTLREVRSWTKSKTGYDFMVIKNSHQDITKNSSEDLLR